MAGHRDEARRRKVALLLAAGRSKKEAAEKAGVSRRSVSNWMREPEFAEEVQKLRDRLVTRTVGRLAGAGDRAVRTLAELAGDKSQKGSVRATAANTLLNHLFRGVDLLDVTRRLQILEELERQRGEK
jgi:Homeodomain-like domain